MNAKLFFILPMLFAIPMGYADELDDTLILPTIDGKPIVKKSTDCAKKPGPGDTIRGEPSPKGGPNTPMDPMGPGFPGNSFCDDDPPQKGGGKDPAVFGKWGYVELGNDKNCSNSPNPFDYDNDGFKEHMCYWYSPQTKILFVDFNGNKQLDNGYELLQSAGYANVIQILFKDPKICTISDCYIWTDSNSNILVDEGETKSISEEFTITSYEAYMHGVELTGDSVYMIDGRDRGFFVYASANTNYGVIYATAPTYWMKGY